MYHYSGGRDENPHDNNHHNRRKAVRPLKQSQRVMQFVGDVVKMSNEMRDKEAGIDVSYLSFLHHANQCSFLLVHTSV